MKKNIKLLQYIGANIRCLREELGYSQEDFAKVAGMERSYYGRIERGQQNMSMLILAKLCLSLQCNPACVIPDYFTMKELI